MRALRPRMRRGDLPHLQTAHNNRSVNMIVQLRRLVSVLLIASLSAMGMPLSAQAGMVTTDRAVAAADRAHIASQFDRTDVRAQLEALGVSVTEAKGHV